jgi:hypothetical protein
MEILDPSSLRKQGPRATGVRCTPGFPLSRELREGNYASFY